ncbi:hypothetical protein URS_2209 [Acinetobacter ursingii]|nr:hypothetical protein URS_2209 [Acinetobacter ursingii]
MIKHKTKRSWRHTPFRKPQLLPCLAHQGSWRHTPFRK